VNLNDISTQLLYTTAPLWVERRDGSQIFGTGFFYAVPLKAQPERQVVLLVTNHHVVENAARALVDLVERAGDGPKRGARVRVEMPGDAILRHTDAAVDLAMIPIGGVLNELEHAGKAIFFRSVAPELVPSDEAVEQLAAVEEITFIGYPSGLYDQRNVTPLVRRGITATPPWNDFQGQRAFLIDAGVFPGSSGSPVFILNQGAYATREGISLGNRLLFMGVLSEAIVRQEKDVPQVFLGLGKVIKATVVSTFASGLAGRLIGAG